MQQPPAMRIERLQERRGKAAGRAEARAGRNVRERRDFELRRPEVEQLDRFANDRMLHVGRRLDVLELRVLQVDAFGERTHHRHVDVLVDRRRDEESTVLAVVGRQVRATATERDAKRAARDDHSGSGPAALDSRVRSRPRFAVAANR